MAKSREIIQRESREQRLQVWTLTQGGMKESKALKQVFPTDTNRRRTMNTWVKHGLYPPPEAMDTTEAVNNVNALPETTTKETPEDTLPRQETITPSYTELTPQETKTDTWEALRAMAETIEPTWRPSTAPGKQSELRTTSITVRLPTEIVRALKARPKSRLTHEVERACKLYLMSLGLIPQE